MTALPLISEPLVADEEAGLGCLSTARGNLPLSAVDLDAHVTGLLHATRVRQTFVNPHDEPLEATYIFPLPDRAAVTAFRMEVGDRVVEGELKERAEAREAYEQAINAGQRAAIAEEERPNVFTVRVGNLMPGDRAVVELELTGPLALDEGEATWRFPLVVAPRYIPGVPLPGAQVGDGVAPDTDAVPDASRITPPVLLPGFPNPVRFTARLDVDPAGLPVSGLRCSLPAEVEGRTVTIRPGQRLDRDLIVRFDVGAEAVGTSLVAHDNTFALTIVPPDRRGTRVTPRDVVFVLDRSGSMGGWKMIAARRAVARMIDTLGARDRFAVLAFDHVVERPRTLGDGLIEATDRHRFRAVEFLATLDARGGTEMLDPLRQGVTLLAAGGAQADAPRRPAPGHMESHLRRRDDDGATTRRERVLVLATDGQVGNEDEILAAVGAKASGVRIFTVGIDTAVNDAFLRRLAAVGGGSCEVVESEDRLDTVMDRIHRRIGTPVLTDVRVAAAGLDINLASIAPSRLPALHAGAPLLVLGRHAGPTSGAVRVTATDADGNPWSAEVTVVDGGGGALTPAWARARIRDLEDRYVVNPSDATEREIVATSLDGHVLSRFTAFVAVDVTVVNEGGKVRRVTQPVDAPHGWDMFGGAADYAPMSAGYAAPAGAPMAQAAGAVGGAMPPAPPMMMPSAAPAPMAGGDRARGITFNRRKQAAQPAQPARAAKPKPPAEAEKADGFLVDEKIALLDLAPYRERAAALVDRVTAGELGAAGLRRELTDLIDDLRSVGAGNRVDPLVGLLATLVDGTWSGDLDALRQFASDTAAGGKDRAPERRAFWKR